MQKVAALVSVLLLALLAGPSTAAPTGEYDDIVNKFFDLISQGKPGDAVDFLYKTNPWSDKVQDAVQQVKTSIMSLQAMSGNYRGSALILKKVLGDRLVYMYYLVAYDRQPLRFEFQFYRPGDKWVVQSFTFSDKITDDIRDFAKNDLSSQLK